MNVGGIYGHRLWDVYGAPFATTDGWTYAAGTPATSWDGSCASVDCHDNKATSTVTVGTTVGYGWYDVTTTACIMCHDDIQAHGARDDGDHARRARDDDDAGGGRGDRVLELPRRDSRLGRTRHAAGLAGRQRPHQRYVQHRRRDDRVRLRRSLRDLVRQLRDQHVSQRRAERESAADPVQLGNPVRGREGHMRGVPQRDDGDADDAGAQRPPEPGGELWPSDCVR